MMVVMLAGLRDNNNIKPFRENEARQRREEMLMQKQEAKETQVGDTRMT